MRSILLVTALLLAAATPVAAGGSTVTVHLLVDTVAGGPVPLAACDVTVPAGSNVEAVLDGALAQGCILQWSCSALFSSPGNCFLDSIDFVSGPGIPTWWSFLVDGSFAAQGVSQTTAQHGSTYRFAYDQSVVFL